MTEYLVHNHPVSPAITNRRSLEMGEAKQIGYLTHWHKIPVAKDGYQVEPHGHLVGEAPDRCRSARQRQALKRRNDGKTRN